MQCEHALTTPRFSTPTIPRLSRRTGFWAIAFSFLILSAFSTAPSALYGLYAQHAHLAPLTLTVVYAVYAAGVTVSLLLAGHVSDWYGRKAVLLPALALAAVAAVLFIAWQSLAGLLLARVFTGLALGATVATATAYLADLDARRSGVVSAIANVSGLAIGPLAAGLLARYTPDGLTLPFVLLLAGLGIGGAAVLLSPEGREPAHPLPRYRPQQLKLPAGARVPIVGVVLAFATWGLFAGLAGRFLAGPLHHPSPALTGAAVFFTFGIGVIVQTTTTRIPAHRLSAAGIPTIILGLTLLVGSAWTHPASLPLFLIGGVVTGAGASAIFRASLGIVIATSRADDRAGALATFFTAGYIAISVPVLGLGVALLYLSPRVTLLLFGLTIAAGVLAAAPTLTRHP
jgi:predicted MFS family arabinose efflux permease